MISHSFRATDGRTVVVRPAGPSPMDDTIVEGLTAQPFRLTQGDARHLTEAISQLLAWDGSPDV